MKNQHVEKVFAPAFEINHVLELLTQTTLRAYTAREKNNPSEVRIEKVPCESKDCISLLLYLRGISSIMVPEKFLSHINVNWKCHGTWDPSEESHMKNLWRLCQITLPADERIPLRVSCNNKAFDNNLSDTNLIYVSASTMRAYLIADDPGLKTMVSLPKNEEEWITLNI